MDTDLSSTQLKQLGSSGKQYLFEEMSITPVEQLSVRQINQANNHQLYALATSDIETWQQSAALIGMRINALLPDFLLLPVPDEGAGQQVTLYQDRYTMLVRQSLRQGMAVSYLPLMLEHLPHLSEISVVPAIEPSDDLSVNDENTDTSNGSLNLQEDLSDPKAQTLALSLIHI